MTPELLFSSLASYRAAFDHVWVFRFPGELVLLGFRQKPELLTARWEAYFAEANEGAEVSRAAGFAAPGELLKHFALDTAALDRILPHQPDLLEDDVPRLALELAARRLRGAAPVDVDEPLREAFPPDLAAHLPHAATRERWITDAVLGWLDQGAYDEAGRWARKLRWGFSTEGRSAQVRAALAAGEHGRAEALMHAALRETPERGDVAALWIRAATTLVNQGTLEAREARLEEAKALAARMPDDGAVLAALARMLRFMGRIDESRAAFERALAARSPAAPDRSRIQFARILLSGAYDRDREARARELLAADPATYLDVDTLDLLVRLTTSAGEESKAEELEKTLVTLQRTRGLALLRAGAGHLVRHEFPLALEAARRCCVVWASQPEPFELRGLAALACGAAPDSDPAARKDYEKEAREAFSSAAARSDDPPAAVGRGQRILAWFGLAPTPPAPRPDEDAE
jgi:tetratricopeptide (TPR) repeat protein